MGLDLELLVYNGLEHLIISQFMAGGIPSSRNVALLLVGTSAGSNASAVMCRAHYLRGSKIEEVSTPAPYIDIIRYLPNELSIGTKYGPLPEKIAKAVLSSLPQNAAECVGELRDAAVFAEGTIYLAAFNYLRPVTQFDAELLRGLSLYLSLGGRLSGYAAESDGAFKYIVSALARAAEANDTDTGNHNVRVNTYAGLIAKELGMSAKFVSEIGFLAQLHDVGKIHIAVSILRKPGRLTPEEWAEMKQHTSYGARIIGDLPRLSMARAIALTHHERYDGCGYPEGLKGEKIPVEGRIVAVADVYDAIRNARSYKLEMSHDAAVKAICNGDERTPPGGFDPVVVGAFMRLEKQFEVLYSTMK